MKNKIKKMFIFIILISIVVLSIGCTMSNPAEKEDSKEKESVKTGIKLGVYSLSNPQSLNLVKGINIQKVENFSNVYAAVFTIENSENNIIFNSVNKKISGSDSSYSTSAISLEPGVYTLTEFKIVDASGKTLYYCPVSTDPKAVYVNDPIPVNFTVLDGQVATIYPKVVSNDDKSKPELLSISVDKEEVNVSDIVNIEAEAADNNGSGIKSIEIEISRNYGDQKPFECDLKYNSTSNKWETNVSFENYHESGIWEIAIIEIIDFAGNAVEYQINKDEDSANYVVYDIDSGNYLNTEIEFIEIDLTGGSINSDKPQLESISVDNKTITDSGTVKIEVKAEDSNGSGIKSIGLDISINDGNQLIFEPDLIYNSVSEKWEANVSFENYHESGTYSINFICIRDEAGNSIAYEINKSEDSSNYVFYDDDSGNYLNTEVKFIEIEFTGDSVNSYNSELISISTDKTTVNGSGTVKIEIEAKENSGSGIRSIEIEIYPASGNLSSFQNQSFIYELTYNSSSNKWEGNVSFENYHESGEWQIEYIKIRNAAGDFIQYEKNINSTYEIFETNTDTGIDIIEIIKE